MTDDWTPETLADEQERRTAVEAAGDCPDSGYTIGECWAVDLCDCAYSPPHPCPVCTVKVWDLAEHGRRHHPAAVPVPRSTTYVAADHDRPIEDVPLPEETQP